MSYCSVSDVRTNINLESNRPGDSVVQAFIDKADVEINENCGGSAARFDEKFLFTGERLITLAHDFTAVVGIFVGGSEIKEFSEEDNLLEDGSVEEDDGDDAPLYWTDNAGSGDTLSWATDYAFILNRSLKIVKGAAVNSYWESDEESISVKHEYKASGRIKVDANSTAKTTLKLVFQASDDTIEQTFTSKNVTLEITQPSSVSAISVVSSDAMDTSQTVTISGLVNGLEDVETVTLNGTTAVSTIKTFTYIAGTRKNENTAGIITCTSNSGVVTNCTMAATVNSKEDWMNIEVIGTSTPDSATATVQLYVGSTATSGSAWGDMFKLYERNWKPIYSSMAIYLFTDKIKVGDNVRVVYSRSAKSKLIKEISRDIASVYVLLYLVGANTSGANYKDLKTSSLGSYGQSSKVVENLFVRIDRNFDLLFGHDRSSPDFIRGELKIDV